MEDSTSNTFIRNEPDAIIFFRDVYPVFDKEFSILLKA